MDWWSVGIETYDNDGSLVDDEAIGEFVTALVPHSGIVTGGSGCREWGAMMSIQASSAADAVADAACIVTAVASAAGLPAWPIVRAEAVREDALDRELSPDRAGGPVPVS